MMDDYTIPDEHVRLLKQATNTPGDEPLPAKLEAKYWELNRLSNRANSRLREGDLVFLCFTLGYGKPTEQENAPPTIIDLIRSGSVKLSDPVEITWRKQQRTGKVLAIVFNGKDKEDLRVQLDGDSEERIVPVEHVKPVELAAV